jgi:tetratricopeptide (TPR) repeat protein
MAHENLVPIPPGRNNVWFRRTSSDQVIVFVHGVLSDSHSCWTSTREGNSVYWPDLIARDKRFQNVNIFLGGYYTAVDSVRYEIRNSADELRGALHRKDADGSPSVMDKRDIIFLCHSTGGLVVRYMLNANYAEFTDKRVGLILIASPSGGSPWANLFSLVTGLYGHRLGKQLKRNHWTVREIDVRFRALVHEKRIPNLFGIEAYENHFIIHRKWLPNTMVMVTENSAAHYFGPPILLRATDHFTSVKPTDINHPSHELVVDFFSSNFANPNHPTGISLDSLIPVDADEVNRHFVGREDIRQVINESLQALEPSLPLTNDADRRGIRLFWLHGLGGMGKTWIILRTIIDLHQYAGDRSRFALVDFRLEGIVREPRELFDRVASRLTDVFGAEALIAYTNERSALEAVWAEHRKHQDEFDELLTILGTLGPDWEDKLSRLPLETLLLSGERKMRLLRPTVAVLKARGLWADTAVELRKQLDTVKGRPHRYDLPFDDLVGEWFSTCHPEVSRRIAAPSRCLAEALQACIRSLSELGPLLLAFDTFELVPPPVDSWLKFALLPLVRASSPVLVVIASRWSLDSRADVFDRHSWRELIPRTRFKTVDFNSELELVPKEIEQLLRTHGYTGELGQLSQQFARATLGVPLSISILINLVDRDSALKELSNFTLAGLSKSAARDTLLGEVSKRFLEELGHQRDSASDFYDIIMVTILGRLSLSLLSQVWDRADPENRIDELSKKYSIFSDRDIHPTVKRYLRDTWRKWPPPQLAAISKRLLDRFEEIQTLPPFSTPEWEEQIVEYLNVFSWSERDEVIFDIARYMCLFHVYSRNFRPLLEIAEELLPLSAEAERGKNFLSMFDAAIMSFIPATAWEWLAQLKTHSWTLHDRACRDLTLAIHRYDDDPKARLRRFESAFEVLSGDLQRQESVISSYLSVAKKSSDRVAVDRAYEWCVRHKISERDYWDDDLYWIMHDAQKYDQAHKYCQRVLRKEQTSIPARVFLAHVLSVHLGHHDEAEKLMREGLVMRPDDANLNYFLAEILETQTEGLRQAAHHYEAALRVFKGEGRERMQERLLRTLAQLEGGEHKATYVRHVEDALSTASWDLLNNAAWNLYRKFPSEINLAERAARSSVEHETNANAAHTLAAILVRQDKWPDADHWVKVWLDLIEPESLKPGWNDFVFLFEDAVRFGRSGQLIEILRRRAEDPIVAAIIEALEHAMRGSVFGVTWPG